jgi:hypothetical protein
VGMIVLLANPLSRSYYESVHALDGRGAGTVAVIGRKLPAFTNRIPELLDELQNEHRDRAGSMARGVATIRLERFGEFQLIMSCHWPDRSSQNLCCPTEPGSRSKKLGRRHF